MENINTLEAAIGFFSGAVFAATAMWKFIVQPAQKERDDYKLDAKTDRDELKNRLIADLEIYRRSRGSDA